MHMNITVFGVKTYIYPILTLSSVCFDKRTGFTHRQFKEKIMCQAVIEISYLIPPGEFQLRLRQLEKSLLQALNDVKGKILDDDR